MLKEVVISIIIMGLIFLIVNRAIIHIHYRIRGYINLIVGLIFTLIFSIALWLDYDQSYIMNFLIYFGFIGSTIIYSFSFSVYYIRSTKRNPYKHKKLVVTSKHYYKQYLYIVYRYNTDFYLMKQNYLYHGLVIKLHKKDFHDEIIKKANQQNKVQTTDEIKLLGKLIIKNKKSLYYCYLINLLTDKEISCFEKINGFRVLNTPMNDLDKQVIYRMILKEQFEVELEKI